MQTQRRWFAAFLVALGLVSGGERILLAHAHPAAGPLHELFAARESDASPGAAGCAACQARATLEVLALDAHPERHGAAPAAPPEARSPEPLCAARVPAPPARAPPLPIV